MSAVAKELEDIKPAKPPGDRLSALLNELWEMVSTPVERNSSGEKKI